MSNNTLIWNKYRQKKIKWNKWSKLKAHLCKTTGVQKLQKGESKYKTDETISWKWSVIDVMKCDSGNDVERTYRPRAGDVELSPRSKPEANARVSQERMQDSWT